MCLARKVGDREVLCLSNCAEFREVFCYFEFKSASKGLT